MCLQFGTSSCALCTLFNENSRKRVFYTPPLTHKHWHTQSSAQAGARAAPLMPLLPSGPAASWHLSPWRRLIASPALTRGERHAEREKPSLYPFICLLQWWPSPFFFCPLHPPSPPLLLLLCPPSPPSTFIKKPKNERKKKSDRSTVSNLAEIVTHASEHKILPRPSHWPQSKSEEAYLNTAFMIMSYSASKRKFSPFFLVISPLCSLWMCALLKWKIHPVPELTLYFCCDHSRSMSAREHQPATIYRAKARLHCNVSGWWNCCGDNGQETYLKETSQTNVITDRSHFTFSGSQEQNWTELNDIWLMLHTEYLFNFFFISHFSVRRKASWGGEDIVWRQMFVWRVTSLPIQNWSRATSRKWVRYRVQSCQQNVVLSYMIHVKLSSNRNAWSLE